MENNLLIGAVSGNYTPPDLKNWVETSKWDGCERVLLLYNPSQNGLEEYLKENDIKVIIPNLDFWGNEKSEFNFNTGICDFVTSYDLIHNIRFFHIWDYLKHNKYDKILITDVKDVYFNTSPFIDLNPNFITATSEEVIYQDEEWNKNHVHYNLGLIGLDVLLDKPVYNVGVFGGGYDLVREMCSDIYLMSVGKYKVADQTSYNYLIHTKYKNQTKYTNLKDNLAVHLHVINAGLVKFNLSDIPKYKIIHQYDRIEGFKR
tara:strand:+ start:1080 stop:1859 length:780 start_codon:yes stop_codon:yes gene_type:complete